MNRFLTHIALIIMLSALSVTLPANADGKERELADRVFEKYKQREEQKRREDKQQGERAAENSQRDRASSRKSRSNRDRESSRKSSRTRERESRERPSRTRSERSTESRKNVRRPRTNSLVSGEVDESDLLRAARDLDRSLQVKRNEERERRATQRTVRQERQEYSRESRREPRRSGASTSDAAQKLSLDQAVAKVRRTSGGRVLSATTSGQGTSRKHRIKVMIDERRVRTYIVDAATGRIY